MEAAIITCCFMFSSYVVYVVVSRFAYRYSEDNYKQIRRERRLLDGLLQDFDQVSRSVNQIRQQAGQLMEYSGLNQLTVQLNEREKRWISKARRLVYEATECVKRFQELRRKRNSPKWFLWVLTDMVPMVDVAFRMRWIEENIRQHVDLSEEKICANAIYESLEKSRFKVRSLQDRSIVDEIEYQSCNYGRLIGNTTNELVFSLTELFSLHPDLMRSVEEEIRLCIINLQLLQAFMKDLQSLKLGSNLETSWLFEAYEIIGEATDSIDTIRRTANMKRWLLDFKTWRARRKLKEEMMCIGVWISDLLETKERYGFKFIRRDLSKSANQFRLQQQAFPCQITDDRELSSAVNNIRKWPSQIPEKSNMLVSLVASLVEELVDVHQFLKDTKVTEYARNFRSACWEQLKKLAFEADECSKIHLELDSMSNLLSAVIRIKNCVQFLQKCIKVYSIEVREDPGSVVGLEEDIRQLVLRLTDESANYSVISIVGMKGIGKTTLAKNVYYHITIANHFEVRRWVSIPELEYYDENALLTSVGNQVLKTREKQKGKDYWIKKMHYFLYVKRYLVILDNVSSVNEWDALKAAFPYMNNQSRIVATTSNKAVASHVSQNSTPHQLRLLTKEESWELFNQMVQYSPDKKEITPAKEAVGTAGGLPLAIVRVGYLLRKKKVTLETLSTVIEGINQGESQLLWSDNLAVNKGELERDGTLSNCLHYLQLFPRDFDIPVRRIITSWIEHGLVKPSGAEEGMNPKDIAEKYLSKFIDSNLIQVVERNPHGKAKTCRLPTALRDLLLQGKGNSSQIRSGSSLTTSLDGALGFSFDANGLIRSNFRQNGIYHRSILFFDTQRHKPQVEIGEIIRRGIAGGFFRELQFLDLEGVFQPQLPRSIGKLKKLAYMGLRSTYLDTLPSSIGDMLNLETLDLKHTCIQTLPSSIWKLDKLRHLYLNHSCQLPQPTGISMRNLQIISGAFVDEGSPLKDGLYKLNNLRKLGLAFHLKEQDQKVLATWIGKLTCLESLKLRSTNERREPQALILEHFPALQKLSRLYLFGRLLETTSIIYELPRTLTHLTLSASGIKDDPMPQLGELPELRSLSFYSGSYTGECMTCSSTSFRELLVLKLWKLDNLKELEMQGGAMQKLRVLEIRSCKNLTMPIGLTHLKTLHEFNVR